MLNYIKWSSFWKIFVLMLQQIHQRWINVETTLIINFNQRCFNINIWLKMKVEPMHIYQCCFNVGKTTLKKLWLNYVNSTSMNHCSFDVEIWLKKKVEPTYVYRRCFNVDKTTLKPHWKNFVNSTSMTECWVNVCSSALLQHWESRIETALLIAVLMFTRKWLKNKTKLSFQV